MMDNDDFTYETINLFPQFTKGQTKMRSQSDLIFTAAALEQGLMVYRVSQHGPGQKETLAVSFDEYAEGELVVCANGSDFFVRRVVVLVTDFDIEEVAGVANMIVQSATSAFDKYMGWQKMRRDAIRKITMGQARATARQMLADSGIDPAALIEH